MHYQLKRIKLLIYTLTHIALGRGGFQHFPEVLATVNAWKTIFDPFFIILSI